MDYERLDRQASANALTDLHVHTEYSDGADSLEDVLSKAQAADIRDLALTDHDTAHWFTQSGTDAFFRAKALGMSLVRGVEVSAIDHASGKKAHILGYWPGCEPFVPLHLLPFFRTVQDSRNTASLRIIARLQFLGYPITIEDVRANCLADQVFKHHIIKTMYKKGLIPEMMGDFYRQHFRQGGDCYFPVAYVPAADVVAAICADHGFAVLAHPGQQQNYSIIPSLAEAGLMGIEYLHPTHSENDRILVASYSEKFGLFKTAGSDYHGIFTPPRHLGHYSLSGENRDELVRAGLLQR